VVTIEDAADWQLQHEHVARMEPAPPPNVEGRGEIVRRPRSGAQRPCACRPYRITSARFAARRSWTCCGHEHRPRGIADTITPTPHSERHHPMIDGRR